VVVSQQRVIDLSMEIVRLIITLVNTEKTKYMVASSPKCSGKITLYILLMNPLKM